MSKSGGYLILSEERCVEKYKVVRKYQESTLFMVYW